MIGRRRLGCLVLSFACAASAACALCAPASAQQGMVLLLRDGTWIECTEASIDKDRLTVVAPGGPSDWAEGQVDPISWLFVRASDLDRAGEGETVRDRYELALEFDAAGSAVLARRHLLRVADRKPRLAPVVAFWLSEYPDSAAGRELADGLAAFHRGKALEAFQFLSATSADPGAAPKMVIVARRFLRVLVRMLENSEQLDPDARPGEDPVKNGRLSRIRAGILEAGKALSESDEWRTRGNPSRSFRSIEIAGDALDAALADCDRFESEKPGRWYLDQVSRMRTWALKEYLEVHLKAAEFHLERKDLVAASKSVDRALEIDPNDARATALRGRLDQPGRKRG